MPRICTICRHPARQDIEADLRAGIPYRDVARRRNVSNHALWRHRVKHVSLNTVTELATATKIRALLDQAATADPRRAPLRGRAYGEADSAVITPDVNADRKYRRS
jgi:hypothetical protein